MSNNVQRAWFQEKYGRPAVSEVEIDGAYMREAFLANPKTKAKAERVVAFAESRGGEILAFAQTMWGHYWGPLMPKSPALVQQELHLTDVQAAEIFAEIQRATHGEAQTASPDAC